MLNYHNEQVWAEENLSEIISGHHEEHFSINMWASIISDELVGPYMFPA
jgi:hypothetical protein